MKKRFIISVNASTKEQESEFIKFLRSEKASWWHYLANTWLVICENEKFDLSYLRDKTVEVFNKEFCIVFQIGEESINKWAGFGPKTETRNMFKWLKESWKIK